MKRYLGEALVELTEEEFERFKNLDSFKEEVFQAADEVAGQTGRTVIITIDAEEVGTWKHDGFHYWDAKEEGVAKGHALWCSAPAGICTCGRTSPKVYKYFGKDR
jgi:hypothetical protein